MSKDPFTLYIDRLKKEGAENIFEVVDSHFMGIHEEGLSFEDNITVTGKAYLANDHLILNLEISAVAQIPCVICNEKFSFVLAVKSYSHTQNLREIKEAIYSYGNEVRSVLLLKIPQFSECQQGNCTRRKELDSYLKKSSPKTHSPFSELSI